MFLPQVLLIDPGRFRAINEILQAECKGRGRIDTLSLNASLENWLCIFEFCILDYLLAFCNWYPSAFSNTRGLITWSQFCSQEHHLASKSTELGSFDPSSEFLRWSILVFVGKSSSNNSSCEASCDADWKISPLWPSSISSGKLQCIVS